MKLRRIWGLKAIGSNAFDGHLFEAEKAFESEGDLLVYVQLASHNEHIAHIPRIDSTSLWAQLVSVRFIN